MTALLAHQTRFDLLGLVRDGRARFFGFAFPLLLLVVLAGVSGDATTTVDGHTVALKAFYLPGVVTMGLLLTSYGTLVATAVGQRETGVFKRRRATPVPAWTLVAGRALATLAAAALSTVVLLVVARAAYGIGVPASGVAAMAVLVVVGVLACSCLGYAVASFVPTVDAAQPAVQITLLPLYFISGIWFSTDDMPSLLQHVGQALPVEPLAHGMHVAAQGGGLDLGDLGALAVWAVVGLVVAAKRFTWLPR